MIEKIQQIIDQNQEKILQWGKDLFETPELGFKEFETKKKIIDILKEMNIPIEKEYFETGFQVTLGHGKPHIGLMAELDAIVTPGHRCATNEDKAAHSCGHSTQCAIMLATLLAIKESQLLDKYSGTITLFFTPAEEFVDLDYRKNLIQEGKISYLSGKENMLSQHLFDEVDCIIHLHGMGEYHGYRYNVNSQLAGFIYKKFHFIGKASHAAVLPHEGVNALNIFSLFQSAVGMLRETFKEDDINRIHGIVTHGGDSVNTIPQEVIYEAYIRSFNPKMLLNLSEQLSKTAKCCAQALNGDCEIESIPGYLPFNQNKDLSEVIRQNMLNFTTVDQIQTEERSVAAGDIGDLCNFVPTIQFGYTGFKGSIHGKYLEIEDPENVYLNPAKIVALSVVDLLSQPQFVDHIRKNFKPTMNYDDYIHYLNQ